MPELIFRLSERPTVHSDRLRQHRACVADLLRGRRAPAGLSREERRRWWQQQLGEASRACARRRAEPQEP